MVSPLAQTMICLASNISRLKWRNSGKLTALLRYFLRFLTVDVSSALKVAQVDLAAARSHVEQFQEISQANEAALASLSTTHDEYQASTEAELARRQVYLFSNSNEVNPKLNTHFCSLRSICCRRRSDRPRNVSPN